MNRDELIAAIRSSSLSALAWVDAAGEPQVRGAIALVRGEVPTLAFTYADEALARDVGTAATVALCLVDERSTGAGFTPLLLRGRPRLVPDPTGAVFVGELLEQELRRYPPARVYADSPLLRREHWWFLSRVLVEIDVDAVEPFPGGATEQHHLLVVADSSRHPAVRLAEILTDDGWTLSLDFGGSVPSAPAVLFGQDASFPDLERWSQWRYRGRIQDQRFEVLEAPARTGLEPMPGLLERWRRQRYFEKRCRQAIST